MTLYLWWLIGGMTFGGVATWVLGRGRWEKRLKPVQDQLRRDIVSLQVSWQYWEERENAWI